MAPSDKEKEVAAQLRKAQVKIALSLVPKIPLLIGLLVRRLLGIAETARYLDLESDLTLTILRTMMAPSKPQPISKTQAMTLLDPGVKGRIWVSRTTSTVPPEQDIRDALMAAIRSLGSSESEAEALYRIPDIVAVEAEWQGYRAGVAKDAVPEEMSEMDRYAALMRECRSKTTVLYFHGGAYYLCDPSSHRPLTSCLAKQVAGRIYSVRYRLAPQNPFPAALLDAFVSYFTLLYPPPGALHEPVDPRDIVFAGDSAGGNLAMALTQTLLSLRRQNIKISWFGSQREIPLPAGTTLFSPWVDIVQSMPSWTSNSKWDYLPDPNNNTRGSSSSTTKTADDLWPAQPTPRKHMYADDALLTHPLVSFQLLRKGGWTDAPPTWIAWGWECLADEDRYLAARMRDDGVTLVLEEYEAMPHVFPAVLPKQAATKRCIKGWGDFVVAATTAAAAVAGEDGSISGKLKSSYIYVKARTLEEVEGDFDALTRFSERDVFEMAYRKIGAESPLPIADSKL